jgi:hypothetical protein
MNTQIVISKDSKVSLIGDALYIEKGTDVLRLSFMDVETIEGLRDNSALLAIKEKQKLKIGGKE